MVGPYSLRKYELCVGRHGRSPERNSRCRPELVIRKLPSQFRGQQDTPQDPQVKYLARRSGHTLMLTPDATILRLRGNDKGQPARSFLRLKLLDSWCVIPRRARVTRTK